jgi:hypothetical protein
MADAVSWLLIEPGWKVVAVDGDDAGTVEQVVGDGAADIFDGLAVRVGALSPARYVPAEKVGEIEPGRVHLTLRREEVERLDEYEEPAPSEQILPENASLGDRIAGAFRRLLGR